MSAYRDAMKLRSEEARRARADAAVTIIGDRLVKADEIAAAMGVAPRTVYRIVGYARDLGYPIRGEAGVGYVLDRRAASRQPR